MPEVCIEIAVLFRPATREDFYTDDRRIKFGQPYVLESQYKPGMWSAVKGLTSEDVKSGNIKLWLEKGIVWVPVSSMDVQTYMPY